VTTTPKKASKNDKLSTSASDPKLLKIFETTLEASFEESVRKGSQWDRNTAVLDEESKKSKISVKKDKKATIKNKKKIKSSAVIQKKTTLKNNINWFLQKYKNWNNLEPETGL
jgi:hypothetical protein